MPSLRNAEGKFTVKNKVKICTDTISHETAFVPLK